VGFAPIVRIVDRAAREIELCATSEALDTYGTIFAYEASRDAFDRWAGNVREMHERKAVGRRVAVRCDDAERKVYVRVRISRGARDTWEKILDGTLRGASIGASNVEWSTERRQEREIAVARRYDLVELSLVDLPSNPDALGVTFVRDGVPVAELLDELPETADVMLADVVERPSAGDLSTVAGVPITRYAQPALWDGVPNVGDGAVARFADAPPDVRAAGVASAAGAAPTGAPNVARGAAADGSIAPDTDRDGEPDASGDGEYDTEPDTEPDTERTPARAEHADPDGGAPSAGANAAPLDEPAATIAAATLARGQAALRAGLDGAGATDATPPPARAAYLAALGAPGYVSAGTPLPMPGSLRDDVAHGTSTPMRDAGMAGAGAGATAGTQARAVGPDGTPSHPDASTRLPGQPAHGTEAAGPALRLRGPFSDNPDGTPDTGVPARAPERPTASATGQTPEGNREAVFHTAVRGILLGCGCATCQAALAALDAGEHTARGAADEPGEWAPTPLALYRDDAGARAARSTWPTHGDAFPSLPTSDSPRLDPLVLDLLAARERGQGERVSEVERRLAALEAQPMPGGPQLRVADKTHPLQSHASDAGVGERLRALEALAGQFTDPNIQIAIATEMIRLQQVAAGLPPTLQAMPRAGSGGR
jgi:hypothetical protein